MEGLKKLTVKKRLRPLFFLLLFCFNKIPDIFRILFSGRFDTRGSMIPLLVPEFLDFLKNQTNPKICSSDIY